jgi:LysM repeat protein
VRQGDTLSSIARKVYGHASRWPSLWYANRQKIHNPNVLQPGQKLRLSPWHPRKDWILLMALRHVPRPAPVLASPQHVEAAPAVTPAVQPASPAQPIVSYSGGSGFQACVIKAESAGNPSAVNSSSGAGGLYGFLPSTWQALGHGGLPENASVAEQNQAFSQEYAQSGTAAWSPYDGC